MVRRLMESAMKGELLQQPRAGLYRRSGPRPVYRTATATPLPEITVPCGLTEGSLPIGMQVIGRSFGKSNLFKVASGYEAVSPALGP